MVTYLNTMGESRQDARRRSLEGDCFPLKVDGLFRRPHKFTLFGCLRVLSRGRGGRTHIEISLQGVDLPAEDVSEGLNFGKFLSESLAFATTDPAPSRQRVGGSREVAALTPVTNFGSITVELELLQGVLVSLDAVDPFLTVLHGGSPQVPHAVVHGDVEPELVKLVWPHFGLPYTDGAPAAVLRFARSLVVDEVSISERDEP